MRMLTTLTLAAVLFLGCKAGPNHDTVKTTEQDDAPRTFVLDVLPGGPDIPQDARPTIRFDDEGRISGFAGCNRYNGPIVINDAEVSIGPLAATKMLCPDHMDLERAFLDALQSATTLVDLGEDLMFEADGELVLYFIRQAPAPNGEE